MEPICEEIRAVDSSMPKYAFFLTFRQDCVVKVQNKVRVLLMVCNQEGAPRGQTAPKPGMLVDLNRILHFNY
jgi:hypothetical protein